MSTSVPPDLLREVIREVVREVIREVIAEEVAAGLAESGASAAGAARRPADRRPAAPSAAAASGSAMFTRGALTERHVRAVGKSGTITISRAVVVTPLARERARAMGVEIIRIEG